MNFKSILGLAFRYLWQRKLRTFLTVLGVVIGVGALTLLVSFGLGLGKWAERMWQYDDLMSMVVVFSPDESALEFEESGRREPPAPLDKDMLERIRLIPGVADAYPDVAFGGSVGFAGREERMMVVGMPPYGDDRPVRKLLQGGGLFSSTEAREIILSQYAHQSLLKDSGLVSLVGKTIVLSFSRDPRLKKEGEAGWTESGTIELKVVGVLAETGHEMKRIGLWAVQARLAVVPAGLATKLWDNERVLGMRDSLSFDDDQGPNRRYSRILVRVSNPSVAEKEVKPGLAALKVDFLYFPDVLEAQKRSFIVFNIILGVIGGISLVVASVGIVNTLVMSILERTREIGIMRAIGASNGEMWTLVMFEGALIGLLGGLIGYGACWALGSGIDAVLIRDKLGGAGEESAGLFYFPLWFFFGTVGFATGLSWVASLYPSWRAVRVDPVQALRHE
ncbi:MAG: ABC transporter permease [Planctomycetes bacterium]|nr:ABC transporter permease [Planctomycetota bacterium]